MPSPKCSSLLPSASGRIALWGCLAVVLLAGRSATAGVAPPPKPAGSEAVVVQPGEPPQERKKHAHAQGSSAKQDGNDGPGKSSRAAQPPSK